MPFPMIITLVAAADPSFFLLMVHVMHRKTREFATTGWRCSERLRVCPRELQSCQFYLGFSQGVWLPVGTIPSAERIAVLRV